MSSATPRTLAVGSWVNACREADDDDWELCQVLKVDTDALAVSLRFDGGYVASGVPLSRIRLPAGAGGGSGGAASASAGDKTDKLGLQLPIDDGYAAAVIVPSPPSAEAIAADPEAKYRYIDEYKAAGNALFKAEQYAWAIRTYTDAVDRLTRHCYPSRDRMLWDYLARGPCGQCYSNAALCALKLGDYAHAETLCEHAMECRPEDADLTKVLLRHGQSLLGQSYPSRALPLLERASSRDPTNRSVRQALTEAKKKIAAEAREIDARTFAHVDLTKHGLTSRRAAAAEGAKDRLGRGFGRLLEGADEAAAAILEPLLASKIAEGASGALVRLQAAYGAGVAQYHLGRHAEADRSLQLFLETKGEMEAEGRDVEIPAMGLSLALFYAAHAAYSTGALPRARQLLTAYLRECAAAGPQPVLNMPDGWAGKKISEEDRKASRFRHRAASAEARADAHTMLALMGERVEGPAAAVGDALEAARLADLGGVLAQRLAARESLAKLYGVLGDALAEKEQLAAADLVRGEMKAKEAERVEKERKEEEEKQDRERKERGGEAGEGAGEEADTEEGEEAEEGAAAGSGTGAEGGGTS